MPDPVQQAAGSNISFGVAIVAILLFIFGAVLGEHMAEIWGYKLVTRRDYFLANLGWFVGCIFLSSLVWALGWSTLTGFFFGILAGGMAGFKIAFGESIGPWKVIDKYFKVNKSHVAAASDPQAAKRRHARKQYKQGKAPKPEYISTAQSPVTSTSASASKAAAPKPKSAAASKPKSAAASKSKSAASSKSKS